MKLVFMTHLGVRYTILTSAHYSTCTIVFIKEFSHCIIL